MKMSVLGAGWLGLPICLTAHATGWDVSFSQTSESAAFRFHYERWHPWVYSLGQAFPDAFVANAQRLVVALPPSLKGKSADPIASMEALADFLAANVSCPVLVLSSTGVYDGLWGQLAEESAPGTTQRARDLYALERVWSRSLPKLALFRLGGLIGSGRNPGIWSMGKTELERPQDSIQLVHRHDAVRAVMAWLQEPFYGAYNVVCDYCPSRLEFYSLWNPHIKPLNRLEPESQMVGVRKCLNGKIKKAAHLDFEVNGPEDFLRNSG